MKIQHSEYGEVEGVESLNERRCLPAVWTKCGAYYYESKGWSEVPEKHWVEAPSHRIVEAIYTTYICKSDEHLKCVKRYDLPASLVRSIEKEGYNLVGYLKPCLIVEEYK